MGFQVNGTTIIDGSRNFSASAFPKVVNGGSLVGSGDAGYKRPGVSSNHVVGDYLLVAHGGGTSRQGGDTVAGSGFSYYSKGACMLEYSTNVASISISGTWRVCVKGFFDNSTATYANAFYARIS